ncbi:MAG: phenylalanine--tRNA ligase subunit alpha [Deltaproteobacteria bacterium]|nr:phenylalanine--tRNA ligase subunit alpha [Deltaproteobacteria bacterium]
MSSLITEIEDLGKRFAEEIVSLRHPNEILQVKANYLGKKGHLSSILRRMGEMTNEERPKVGQMANSLKGKIEEECRRLLDQLKGQLLDRKTEGERADITLPGRGLPRGHLHPVRQVMEEVEEIFVGIGFQVHEGPEVESDYYNFEALNIPADHPARDMQDTFYVGAPLTRPSATLSLEGRGTKGEGDHGSPYLLRTHTSPVQIHVMERQKPPIQMIAPGAVYRRDSDASHTPMFHQVEGLLVDQGVRFSDLKGILTLFLNEFFGRSVRLRFRPSYFPFTEPSAEVDIGCIFCRGGQRSARTCKVCKKSGWLEVMGCGMVSPAVFRRVGYDLKKISGFAFGMGIERMAMLKLGINDIRLFFENDIRFLRQF